MFEFMVPRTSHERFKWRMAMGKDYKLKYWRIRYIFWWWVHNVPAHLLIGFCPIKPFFKFHDWTSDKLHQWKKSNVL